MEFLIDFKKTVISKNIRKFLMDNLQTEKDKLQALSSPSCLQACKANGHALIAKSAEKRGGRGKRELQISTISYSPPIGPNQQSNIPLKLSLVVTRSFKNQAYFIKEQRSNQRRRILHGYCTAIIEQQQKGWFTFDIFICFGPQYFSRHICYYFVF